MPDELQKKSDSKELTLDEIKNTTGRTQIKSLICRVPLTENKHITQVTLDLLEKLNVDINHRLPLKQGNSNLETKQHHPIIVHFLSRHKKNEIFAKRFNAKHISNFP